MGFIAPVLSLVGTVVGGVVSAMGAQASAKAQSQAAQYQAAVARNNAIMAQNNAVYERQAASDDAYTQDLKNRAIIGQAETELGASGFEIGTGTPLDLRGSQRKMARVDTLRTRENRELKAREWDQAAINATATGGMYDMQARAARTAGNFNVASSLLSTATSLGDKWTSYQRAGVIG